MFTSPPDYPRDLHGPITSDPHRPTMYIGHPLNLNSPSQSSIDFTFFKKLNYSFLFILIFLLVISTCSGKHRDLRLCVLKICLDLFLRLSISDWHIPDNSTSIAYSYIAIGAVSNVRKWISFFSKPRRRALGGRFQIRNFQRCSNLVQIVFRCSIREHDESSFNDCTNLIKRTLN